MTDADFMLSVLQDGEAHSTMDLIQRSIAERGCGLTPHSRAASLRERGHIIACHRVPGPRWRDRPTYQYKLIASNEASRVPSEGHTALSSAAETALDASLGARTTAVRGTESARPHLPLVSPSPLPPSTPATAAAAEPETRPLSLFDVPEAPAWA